MPRVATLFAACLLFACTCMARTAHAQVQRCETPDGRTVYTDKQCEDVGAAERVPRSGDQGQASSHRRQCSRTLQDLTFELTMSIDARDANRLAALYHWPGIDTNSGYAIMARLDAIAQRPLVDVRPEFPDDEAPPLPPEPTDAPATDPSRPPSSSELMRRTSPWRPSTASTTDTQDAAVPEPPPASETPRPRRVPHAIRVEQALANTGTPSRTVFGLRRHLGCWWISF